MTGRAADFSNTPMTFTLQRAFSGASASMTALASALRMQALPRTVKGRVKRDSGAAYGPTKKHYHHKRTRFPKPFTPHECKVERLTNWQRTQWARAGYKPERLDEFAAMERPTFRK